MHRPSGNGQKPAAHLLEPDGERIDPGHNLNLLHDDVFPPRRSSVTVEDDDHDEKVYDDRGRDQQTIETAKLSPGQESPQKKPKSAHHHPHLKLPHVAHFKKNKKHTIGGRRNDPLGTAEHHRDTSSIRRIEETLSKESSIVESGTRPPPPSAEPSSSSLRSSVSTHSDGVRASYPREHGIQALLHSPILTRSTKAIGKLAHASPHMPHIPELPLHLHLLHNRGPSVEISLAALNLEDTSITSILEHMKKHSDHVKVQERGCARLTSLAKQRDHMQEITDAGGIEIILNAARNHNEDTELLSQSFSALGNISALNSDNKQKIGSQGIETIISSMRAHAYDPVLQERACGLLFNLSFDHQNKELIAENGGIEAIIEAMKHFPAYANLQHNAVAALWNLGGSVANKERIATANGVHTIIRSMDTHREHSHIQRSALGALRTLSMHHGAKDHIAQHGGVASTLNAMRHHSTDRHVQKEGCGLMRNLLTHHSHREHLRSHRPERELEHAADNFPVDCEDNAWSCLERLEEVSERNNSSRNQSKHAS